ncbi:MAG: ISL3 family transposase [Fimbriimonadaceae bacterium]|nr:ISL3 family transposase [Fimbriimonadaceae bacterium]
MDSTKLFELGLGLVSPWKIVELEFRDGEVHIEVDFERGGRFEGLPVHDTAKRSWRHLDFFKYPCYIEARVPRVKGKDGKVRTVEVPWARPGSGFTMDFEACAISLMRDMPVYAAARKLKVHDTRLWRILHAYVKRCLAATDIGEPSRVGVDETSARRGHDYVTAFVDLVERRTLFVTAGRSGSTLGKFKKYLRSKGVKPGSVLEFSCDMSPAFLSGIRRHFPKAGVTLDKYHLVALVSRALDEVRREESRGCRSLKRTRWLWLKNPTSLTDKQRLALEAALTAEPFSKTARCYGLKLEFQELFHLPREQACHEFYRWIARAFESGVRPIQEAAVTLFNAAKNVLNWFETQISTGLLEGYNSVLQATKRKARGYRTTKNLIAMSYLLHGKLAEENPQ